MKIFKSLTGKFHVLSDLGKKLGEFSTIPSAQSFIKDYSGMKKYSNEVNKLGSIPAMKLLRTRINKS